MHPYIILPPPPKPRRYPRVMIAHAVVIVLLLCWCAFLIHCLAEFFAWLIRL